MNPKETTIFEGVVVVVAMLILFGWLTFRSFTKPAVTASTTENIAADSLSDPVLSELAQNLNQPDNFFNVPVSEPTAGEKDKGTLVP